MLILLISGYQTRLKMSSFPFPMLPFHVRDGRAGRGIEKIFRYLPRALENAGFVVTVLGGENHQRLIQISRDTFTVQLSVIIAPDRMWMLDKIHDACDNMNEIINCEFEISAKYASDGGASWESCMSSYKGSIFQDDDVDVVTISSLIDALREGCGDSVAETE